MEKIKIPTTAESFFWCLSAFLILMPLLLVLIVCECLDFLIKKLINGGKKWKKFFVIFGDFLSPFV